MTPKSSPLPPSVVQRLEQERLRIENGAFSSSFGVGEWLLSRAGGYEALGQVMGASVFQIGTQYTSPLWRSGALVPTASTSKRVSWRQAVAQGTTFNSYWRNANLTPAQLQWQKHGTEMEITTHTAAYATARRTALQRLQAEAQFLGASGVAGVRLSMKVSHGKSGSGASSLEFLAIGTAVKASRFRRQEAPWLSNLSGQELWQLESAGYAPCGFVGGNCSWYQTLSLNSAGLLEGDLMRVDQETLDWAKKQNRFGFLRTRRLNFELPEFSQAVYKARELALTRLEAEAKTCDADGIVGLRVELDENAHIVVPASAVAMRSITFSFLALGTAIRREGSAPKTEISAILNLK